MHNVLVRWLERLDGARLRVVKTLALCSLATKVRTAAAVASLRALVEITANVCDPLARRAFADVRTGQMLLSIITSEHGSAVLQARID